MGRDALSTLFTDGTMTGYGGYMRPEASITRGEFFAVVNRTFGFTKTANAKNFSDIDYADNTWKTSAVQIASAQGYLEGAAGKALADQVITREQAFTILSRILKQDAVQGGTTFSDDGQVSAWAREQINAMWKAGYVEGYQNKLNPQGNLSRAETAQVVCNVMGTRIAAAGTYDLSGREITNLTVICDGAHIKNAVVKGNLYITEGVGTGTVTLETCSVAGTAVISGGGVNSIVWIDTSTGPVKIDVPDGTPVRLVLTGNSSTGDVTVSSNGTVDDTDATGAGVKTITIAAPEGATVRLIGSFDSVEVNAPVTIVTGNSTVINTMTFNNTAEVQGKGTVKQANVNANGITFEVMPESMTVDSSVTVPPTQSGSETPGPGGPSYQVQGIKLSGSFGDVNGVTISGKWVFDLTDTAAYKDSDTISKIMILTDGASSFTIENVGSVPTNQDVTITDALDVLGMSGPSTVSFGTLRKIGSEVTIKGKVSNAPVTIVFQVKSDADAYYRYAMEGSTVTATLLKDDAMTAYMGSFGMDPVAVALIRFTPVDLTGTYEVTATKGTTSIPENYTSYSDMKNGLTTAGIVSWLNASGLGIDQLSDLTGCSVSVKHNGTLVAKVVFAA